MPKQGTESGVVILYCVRPSAQEPGGACHGSGGRDHVIGHENGTASDITDDVGRFDLAAALAALVDDRDLAAQHVGVDLRPLHIADVRRDEHPVRELQRLEPLRQHRPGGDRFHAADRSRDAEFHRRAEEAPRLRQQDPQDREPEHQHRSPARPVQRRPELVLAVIAEPAERDAQLAWRGAALCTQAGRHCQRGGSERKLSDEKPAGKRRFLRGTHDTNRESQRPRHKRERISIVNPCDRIF